MEFIRLNHENAYKYIGYEIIFKTRGIHIVKKIISINKNSIKIDHPDLNNQLSIRRKIFVLK